MPPALRKVGADLPVWRGHEGWIVLAIDVSNWLRPHAATSPDRLFFDTYRLGRALI